MKQNVYGDIYAFSDLHGNYRLFKQIKGSIKENDVVICLGDCCDRGPDGIKIIQEILRDSRFIYLMGNHEAMLVDAIDKSLIQDNISFRYFDRYDMEILKHNGTIPTLQAYQLLPEDERKYLFQKLLTLPSLAIHKTRDNKEIFLCHAGADARIIFNQNADDKILYWDRKHIATEKWDIENHPNTYVIHGHTPVQTLGYYNKEYKEKPIPFTVQTYCDGHKIDIDLATPTTKKVALINVETFEVKYFTDEEESE